MNMHDSTLPAVIPRATSRRSLLPIVLRDVDQVARSGSVQGAAKELHGAASAVNRQVLGLERELGVPLFERLPRAMRPTPSGDAIATLARRWRDDERRVAAEIRRHLDAHDSWLLNDARAGIETNSLQLVKAPVRDKGAEPQTVSIAITAGKPFGPVVKVVAGLLSECIRTCVDEVRAARAKATLPEISAVAPRRRKARA